MPTNNKVELIGKEEFTKLALDKNFAIFIIYVSSLSLELKIIIYLARKTQIALLLAKKVTIASKYLDFANIFLKKLVNVLLKQTRANKYIIKLEQGKQPLYWPIYNLKPIAFETVKIYVKTNLANDFIRASKLQVGTLILFDCKCNSSFCLYVNY